MNKKNIIKYLAIMLIAVLLPLSITNIAFASDSTVYTTDAVKKALYSEMINRDSGFSITYVGSDADDITNAPMAFFGTVFNSSDDYLKWNRSKFQFEYTQLDDRLDMTFNISYLTTKAEEDFVDMKVNGALASIIKPGMSDYEKLSAVHSYICDNVSYDYTLKKYSAYEALASGKAVCQGYSLLMDKMLEKAGVKTIIIDGSIPEGGHAWNLVKLDDVWYHVDATNDDINKDMFLLKTDSYMKKYEYKWTASEFPAAVTAFEKPFKITINVDGRAVSFDVAPYINSENRTMVPVRFVSETLGATVGWNNAAQMVTVENEPDVIKMIINDDRVLVNGEPYTMDTAATIKNNRTMVPLRFISEYLGAEVKWDEVNHIINIYSDSFARND